MAGFDDAAKLKAISTQPYKEQAIDFLNAYWDRAPINFQDAPEKREAVWDLKNRCVKLDKAGEKGSQLDEFQSHRLLEQTRGAMTVQEMRRIFADIDVDHNHSLSLCEFLIYAHGVDWVDYVNAPKTDNERVAAAHKMVAAAQRALQLAIDSEDKAQAGLKASMDAEVRAMEEEAASVERARKAKEAEEEVASAREAQEPALASVNSQEDAFKGHLADLEAKSKDETLSTVKRNKAVAELAQLKQEDPMPLRKARIGLEAAIRRLNKALKHAAVEVAAAAAAHEAAVQARKDAEEAKKASELSAQGSTEARLAAEDAMKDAQECLEVTRAQFTGSAGGALWWMERELQEAKKYMPKAKLRQLEQQLQQQQASTVVGAV